MPDPIKVMIIDDEILAIEDLEQLIPWRQHGFEIVAIATSSQKALELFEKYRPQIIFADIRMPVMDGLEFSRRVLAYRCPVKIILLTAYKDFDYAQQAVAIGVANYLLKHEINETSLIRELQKVRSELESSVRRDAIVKQRIIKRILSGESLGDWSNEELGFINQNQEQMALLSVQPDTPYLEQLRIPSGSDPVKLPDIKGLELPDGVNWTEGFDLDELGFIVLAGLKKLNSQAEEREILYQYASTLQHYLGAQIQPSISIVFSRSCRQIEELPALYRTINKARQYLVFYRPKQLLYCEDLPVGSGHAITDLDRNFSSLAQGLQAEDATQVQTGIAELFQKIHASWNLDRLRQSCDRLLNRLEQYRGNHGLPSLIELCQEGKLQIDSLCCCADLQAWFGEQYVAAIHQALDLGQDRYSRKVQQAIGYIRQHYAADLTVDYVAEALGISGVYLSQLFKKETGRTFLEYLTDYRIHIAKDLLERGDYKIYEVAAMVGYKTGQYFSHVFRKVTGVYPVDCRKGAISDETGD